MNTEKKLVTKCFSVFPAFQSSEIAIRSTLTCPEYMCVCVYISLSVEDFSFVFVKIVVFFLCSFVANICKCVVCYARTYLPLLFTIKYCFFVLLLHRFIFIARL